jgi:GT2 family glycosyltransferase
LPGCNEKSSILPLVSLIVVNYNGQNYIVECLTSLLNQTFKDFEVIVVDNNSSDQSASIVTSQFPNIRLIQSKSNRGFAAGTNLGIENSSGKYIGLFNFDAVADPRWLERLVSALKGNEKAGVAAGPIFYYDNPRTIWSAGGRVNFLTGNTWQLHQGLTVTEEELGRVQDLDFVPGCALLIKREVVDKIGMLDENYFLYLEDVDWCWAVRSVGYEICFVKDAIVHHSVSSSWSGRNEFGYYQMMKSKFYFLFKFLPRGLAWIPVLFQIFGLSLGEAVLFRRPKYYVMAKLSSLSCALPNSKKTNSAQINESPINILRTMRRTAQELTLLKERVISKRYYW